MEHTTLPLITISGPPASGTSTLTQNLAEEFDFEVINGGDIFRRIASEKDLTLAELTKLSEEDDSIDKELDQRLEDIISSHISGNREPNGEGLIVESRLAGWHADGKADLSVYLHAPIEVRAERIDKREESVSELGERERSEAKRYKEYYGIDISDLSIYDIVIDTSNSSIDSTFETVCQELIAYC